MSSDSSVPYSKTLEIRDRCLCLHAQRAARGLARRFDEAFRPLGINNGQFSLMISLNRPEPPTLGSVARLLGMDRTTLTAKLKPLERRGWVTVAVDGKDKRGRRLSLTPEGYAVLADAEPIWRATHDAVDADLAGKVPGQGRDALYAGLRALA